MSPKKRNQRLLGYTRVSRMKADGISPELQRASIEAYATAHGHEIVWLEPDLDESGSKLNRPAMRKALAMLANHEADGIIAAKLDRLTRNVGDLGRLLKLAKDEDWNLVAIDLGMDLTTSNGKLVAQLLGSVAEWELDRRAEGWKEARTSAIGSGKYAAVAPAGYSAVNGHLVPNEHAAQVKRAFEVRAAGGSWTDVSDTLRGVPTSRGATEWSLTAALKLTENEAYLGISRSGDLVNTEAHEPLIGRALWERVQARKGTETRKRAKGSDVPAALSGLVYCATCGSIMGRDHNTRKRDGKVFRFDFYRCRNRKCKTGNTISLSRLEEFALTRTLPGLLKDVPPPPAADTVALEESLEDKEAEVAAFLRAVPAQTPGFAEALAIKTATVDEAKAALAEAAAPTGEGYSKDEVLVAVAKLKVFENIAREAGVKTDDLPDEDREAYVAARNAVDTLVRKVLAEAGVAFTVKPGRGTVEERLVTNHP